MKKLEITKVRGGFSWIIPILPLPREFKKETINNLTTNLKKVLEEKDSLVEVFNPDLNLYDTKFDLANVSGDVSGKIYYHTANPPVHSACVSWPGYLGVELDVPDEKYSELKNSLRKTLHPLRSVLLGF